MKTFEIKRSRGNAESNAPLDLRLLIGAALFTVGSCHKVFKDPEKKSSFWWDGSAKIELTRDGEQRTLEFNYSGVERDENGAPTKIKPETSSTDVTRKLAAELKLAADEGWDLSATAYPEPVKEPAKPKAETPEQQPEQQPETGAEAGGTESNEAPEQPETPAQDSAPKGKRNK